MRVLVVEDERDLNDIITKKLKSDNYSVDSSFDGDGALEYIFQTDYDVILLDIMLPRLSGLEVLKTLRAQKNKTPVMLITARDSIKDRVAGLDAGADDYLVKPFALDEMLARVRVMLRHASGGVSNTLKLANLTVDCDKMTVMRDDTVIALSGKEFAILEYLLRNQGLVLSRDKIRCHIWNYDYEGGSNVVDVYIRYLRKKIDEGFSPKLVQTVRGAGYVLREEE